MVHEHVVHDTDARFIIDPVTRTIKNESKKKIVLVQGDHNSEIFGFQCPRYIESHDMSQCNKVEVHYFNYDQQSNKVKSGKYEVNDLQIGEDENSVVFSWRISGNGTQLQGRLEFLIRFKCVEENTVTYAWNTLFFTDTNIGKGSNADESFETEYVDIIEQWKTSVLQGFEDDFTDWKVKTEAQLEIDFRNYRQETTAAVDEHFAAHSSEWNQALAVERARIDQFVALEEGSTTGDAELMDGRISNTGHSFANIGTHIRSVSDTIDEFADNLTVDGYLAEDLYSDVKENCETVEGYFFRCPDSDMVAADLWKCYTLSVCAGEKYRIKTYTVSAGVAVAFMTTRYDADDIDAAILYYPENKSSGEIVDIIVEVPAGAVQMLVNEQKEQCEAIIEKYVSKRFVKASNSVLCGKHLVCCGDSITEAVNPDGGYFANYAEIVAERHGMTCTKDGVGGSTMAYGQGKTFSTERYLNIPEFDYLTIWFGWNDAAYSELGTIEDEDNSTFYGAYRLVLKHLVVNNPTKKIGLIVPYGDEVVEQYAQAVREISILYGIPCLDLQNHNKCSLVWGSENEVQLARRNALTYDGTHPNQAGHDFISTMYESFLLSL